MNCYMWLDLGKPSQFAQDWIEIHFIVYYNSHTQRLSRHSDTIAIDKKVCFYRRLFADPMKPCWTNSDPVRPLACISRAVACGPKLFHSMSALLVVWSGLLWASVWSTVHTAWSLVSESIVSGVRNFGLSKIHLRIGFLQKNRLKCIGTSIITLYLR